MVGFNMSVVHSAENWRDPQILFDLAEPQYDPNLPFHNWLHAITTARKTCEIAENAIKHGVPIDVDVLVPAALFHDGGFWLRPGIDHPFSSKEQYSRHLSGLYLKTLGMPQRKIDHVGDMIGSTERNVPCKSDEARCLRQADLANVSSKKPWVFLNGTLRLYQETKLLNGEPPLTFSLNPEAFMKDFLRYASISYDILSAYNAEDISLGDFDRGPDGVGLFYARATKNINLLVPDRLQTIFEKNFKKIVSYDPINL